MAYWTNKSQRLTNYFPEYYAVRSDRFSLGSMFFNAFADKYFHDQKIVEEYIRDLFPVVGLAERPQQCYVHSTSFSIDNTTTCVVTGYCDSVAVSGSCDVFVNFSDVLEDISFGIPDIVVTGVATTKCLDLTWEVTGDYCEYTVGAELEYDVPNGLEIYVSGYPFWSSTIPYGRRSYLQIKGILKEYPYEETTEEIYISGDSIYKSKHNWLYINSLEAFGLNYMTLVLRAPGNRFPYRLGMDSYFISEYRNPIDMRLMCDNATSGIMTQYYMKIEPRVESVEEPAHVFQVVDLNGEIVSPLDYAMAPRGHQLAVLDSGGTVYLYDMREKLPDTAKDISKLTTCPYHLTFELHSATSITVKLWNKYLNNPFDFNVAIIVQDPAGYRWLLDGVGNRYVDGGQYLTAPSYPKRFIYTPKEFGPHIFYIKYYDTETYSHMSQPYLYNFEKKEPVFQFEAGDAVGISWIRDNTLVTTLSDSTAQYYKLVNYMALYSSDFNLSGVKTTARSDYLTFFSIEPEYVVFNGVTESCMPDVAPTGSYVQFGNLLVAGDL